MDLRQQTQDLRQQTTGKQCCINTVAVGMIYVYKATWKLVTKVGRTSQSIIAGCRCSMAIIARSESWNIIAMDVVAIKSIHCRSFISGQTSLTPQSFGTNSGG